MSFILEALKKSENARQRQSGPGFAGLPEKTETRRSNMWPWIIGALLLINAIIVGVILLRGEPERVAAPAASLPPSATAAPPAPASMQPAEQTPAPAATPSAQAEPASPEPATTDELAQRPERDAPAIRSLADEARRVTEPSTPAETEPPQTATTRQPVQQPVDQIPAKPSPAATKPAGVSAAELPSVQELYLSGELSGPQLNLDLHVYFPQSSRRVVFISGKRYREGDQLDVGMTVKEIIPAGVILSRRGRDYLLQAN